MSMNAVKFDVSSVEKLVKILLATFTAFSKSDCGHSDSTNDCIVHWVHPLLWEKLLQARKVIQIGGIHSWPIADDSWKAAVT